MSPGDDYGRATPETANTAQEITRGDIQNAIEVISKAMLADTRNRLDNPVAIKFEKDVKVFKSDGFIETGVADVASAIAEVAGIKTEGAAKDIQNAVGVLSKVMLADVEKRMDHPVTIEFSNGIKLFRDDRFVNGGNNNVAGAIGDIAGIKAEAPSVAAPAAAHAEAAQAGSKFTFIPNELGKAMYPQLQQQAEFSGDNYSRLLDAAMGEKARDIPAGEFFVGGKNADTVSVALTSKTYPDARPQIIEIGTIKKNPGPKM